MNECEHMEQSIGRWLDGELSAAESELLRAHVAGCAHCGATQQRLEKLERALGGILVAAAPRIEFAPFWRELQQRIDEKTPWHEDLIERVHDWFAAPRTAWAVPAVIVVLLAVSRMIRTLPSGGRAITRRRSSPSTPMDATSLYCAKTRARQPSSGFIKIKKVKMKMLKKLPSRVLLFSWLTLVAGRNTRRGG